jgi:hypothetical protein
MTINLSETTIYIGIIIVLVIIQIYQQTTIKRLEKECKDLWDQLGTLTYSITNKMLEIHKDLNGKQDKK